MTHRTKPRRKERLVVPEIHKRMLDLFRQLASIPMRIRHKILDGFLSFRRNKIVALIIIFLILSSNAIFYYFYVASTEGNSARYFLSALIQSEAAILAIIITLSLVSVQLASSSYSIRVMDLFIKMPIFWTVLAVYIIGIIYGLGILKSIDSIGYETQIPNYNAAYLEFHLTASYFLGILALLLLVWYIWRILNLLRSRSLIETLGKSITKRNILSIKRKGDEQDFVQQIIDIMTISSQKFDYETALYGLRIIRDRTIDIITNNDMTSEEVYRISSHSCEHIFRFYTLALEGRIDFPSLDLIAGSVGEIGVKLMDLNFTKAINRIMEIQYYFVINSFKKGLRIVEMSAMPYFMVIAKKSIDRNMDDSALVAGNYIKDIGINARSYGFNDIIEEAIGNLSELEFHAHWDCKKFDLATSLGRLNDELKYKSNIDANKEI